MLQGIIGVAIGCGVSAVVWKRAIRNVEENHKIFEDALRESYRYVISDMSQYLTVEQLKKVSEEADFRAIAVTVDPTTAFPSLFKNKEN